MKKIKILILILIFPLFLFSQLESSNPESQGISNERLERLSQLSQRYVDDGKVANITTIINRNGKIVYFKSFGKRGFDDNDEVKKDDLYRIYSMTKPIVSLAIMQLYEEGKFHLNDPVEKYIPEFKNLKIAVSKDSLVNSKRKMTVKHLLTHTAGLSYGWSSHPADDYYRDGNIWSSESLDDFTKKISEFPLRFEPGSKYYYSVSVDILGVLIQRISGLSLDKYLTQNIFDPLGMKDTFFEVPKNKSDRFLPNHQYNGNTKKIITIDSGKNKGLKKNTAMQNYYDVNLYSGGGGLVSTAMDYMIFAECLRNGGEYNGKRIIEKSKTIYKVIDKNSNSSLVEMKPITGRKHQLRKQLFKLGNPIIGDDKYSFKKNTYLSKKKKINATCL